MTKEDNYQCSYCENPLYRTPAQVACSKSKQFFCNATCKNSLIRCDARIYFYNDLDVATHCVGEEMVFNNGEKMIISAIYRKKNYIELCSQKESK